MRPLILTLLAALSTTASLSAQARRISLPEGHELTNPDRPVIALSPDGTRLAYVESTPGEGTRFTVRLPVSTVPSHTLIPEPATTAS